MRRPRGIKNIRRYERPEPLPVVDAKPKVVVKHKKDFVGLFIAFCIVFFVVGMVVGMNILTGDSCPDTRFSEITCTKENGNSTVKLGRKVWERNSYYTANLLDSQGWWCKVDGVNLK